MPVDAVALRSWANILCRLVFTDFPSTASALGLRGETAARHGGAELRPPPPGLTELVLAERDGRLDHLRVRFAGPAVTRADLDRVFGAGASVPRVHWRDPHPLAYRVAVPGAPFTCTLFADFAAEPEAGTPVEAAVLRRDRAV